MAGSLVLKPLAGFAAEIVGLDLSRPVADEIAAELRELLPRHLVLRFRDQTLEESDLLRIGRIFGDIDPPGPNPHGRPYLPAFPELNVISNIVEDGMARGSLGSGEAIWHADMTYLDNVPLACALYALEVPPEGGATYWANQFAAYDQLDETLKQKVAALTAVHDASRDSSGQLRKGYEPVSDLRLTVGAHHPVVCRDRATRRPFLFLGRRRNAYLPGLPLAESEALLDALWHEATRDNLVFRQEWRRGDLVIWFNHGTVHRRDAFPAASRRLMYRVQIKGYAPQGLVA